jgi:hypothetical protein
MTATTAKAEKKTEKIDEQFPVDRTRDALVVAMSAKDIDRIEAMFSENMKKAVPPAKLASFLDGLIASKGALSTATAAANTPASPMHAFYDLKAERGIWRMELTVSDNGTILGLYVKEPPGPEPEVKRASSAMRSRSAENGRSNGAVRLKPSTNTFATRVSDEPPMFSSPTAKATLTAARARSSQITTPTGRRSSPPSTGKSRWS